MVLVFRRYDAGKPLWNREFIKFHPRHEVETLVADDITLRPFLQVLKLLKAHRGIAQALMGCQATGMFHAKESVEERQLLQIGKRLA